MDDALGRYPALVDILRGPDDMIRFVSVYFEMQLLIRHPFSSSRLLCLDNGECTRGAPRLSILPFGTRPIILPTSLPVHPPTCMHTSFSQYH